MRLFDFGIHEYRAAGTEVDGTLGQEGCLRKFLNRHLQRFGKGVEEGAAARRAGFIEQDVFDVAVFDAAAFHILTADVEEKIDVRAKMGSGLIVGNRFDFAKIQVERFLEQGFPVAGNAGFGNEAPFGRRE